MMLRSSLSTTKRSVVHVGAVQYLYARTCSNSSSWISSRTVTNNSNNNNNSSSSSKSHIHIRHDYSSTLRPIIIATTNVNLLIPISVNHNSSKRFKSGTPFPSLQSKNNNNEAMSNSNNDDGSIIKKNLPKHPSFTKRNGKGNYNKNRYNNKEREKIIDNVAKGEKIHSQRNNKDSLSRLDILLKNYNKNNKTTQQSLSDMNNNNNKSNSNNTKSDNRPMQPIEKLRESFMQSLQSDRERRRNALHNNSDKASVGSQSSNNFGNTESKLDQLLHISRQKNKNHNHYSYNNNSLGKKSGAKQFRESRKMQEQQQNQRRQDARHENQINRTNTSALRKELLKSNANAMNHDFNDDDNEDDIRNDDDDKIVILPRKDMTLVELSSLLRVHKNKIVKTLRSLGESVPKSLLLTSSNSSDDSEEFKIDVDMAELIALELGLDPQRAKRNVCQVNDAERRVLRMSDNGDREQAISMEIFPSRPPVVCIMGHVDHGKTTLMDSLRQRALDVSNDSSKKSTSTKRKKKGKGGPKENGVKKVAGTEAGGITQTVSAFQIKLSQTNDGKKESSESTIVDTVTFLDTPGHAAFKSMRQSGSNGADVIVLVIASDDGVSPQTLEIIDMYKSIARSQPGSISLVVAMTKIDKPGINLRESMMRIENQLMEHDIFTENVGNSSDAEFGGVQIFPVSGLTGEGLDALVEGLALQSEIMDLRADNEARAEGLVIDAKMEKGLGVVADCIVRWGKLGVGDYVLSGIHGGKVRILNDVNNKSIKTAYPSQPVRIVGLKTLPKAGDAFVCVQSEEMAKEIIDRREALSAKITHRAASSDDPLDVEIVGGASKKGFMAQNILNRYGLGDKDEDNEEENETEDDDEIRIPVILKADADGTLAALRDTILAIQYESKLRLCIDPISIGIGHVTTSDVNMAAESGAAIFCFNLKGSKDKAAMSLASCEGVEIRGHDVIYHLLDEAKEVFSMYCPLTPTDKTHGKATVKAVFDINNNKDAEKIAGLMVEEGHFYLQKSSKESGSLSCYYRVRRDGKVISPDELCAKSLRRVKEEVLSVRRGEECGLNLQNYFDVKEGDIIECYSTEMKRTFV